MRIETTGLGALGGGTPAASPTQSSNPSAAESGGVVSELSEAARRTAPLAPVAPSVRSEPPPQAVQRLDAAERTLTEYLFGPGLSDLLLEPEQPNPMVVLAELVAAELALAGE